MKIAVPAILPSSHKDLREKLSFFSALPAVERIQIDIVDGHFAQPASWPYTNPAEMRDLLQRREMLPRPDRITYEVDLMCLDADRAAEAWLTLGATRLTFHQESIDDLPRFLASAHRRYGPGAHFSNELVSFGVALNIDTDLAVIEPCLGEIAYVQFMGIASIGKQGQPFDERVFEKVQAFRAAYPDVPAQVDGGVTLPVAQKLVALGVTNLVIGSALARATNPSAALASFNDLKTPFGV